MFAQRTKTKAQNYELNLWIVGIVGNWRSSELEKKRVIVSLQRHALNLGRSRGTVDAWLNAPLPIYLSISKAYLLIVSIVKDPIYIVTEYIDLDINVISFSTKMVLACDVSNFENTQHTTHNTHQKSTIHITHQNHGEANSTLLCPMASSNNNLINNIIIYHTKLQCFLTLITICNTASIL